jgi:hypothetical protein
LSNPTNEVHLTVHPFCLAQGLEHWKQFFADHKSYFKVGRVVHHPIDPESPIPEHCDPKKHQDPNPKKNTKENAMHADPAPDEKPVVQVHEEL